MAEFSRSPGVFAISTVRFGICTALRRRHLLLLVVSAKAIVAASSWLLIIVSHRATTIQPNLRAKASSRENHRSRVLFCFALFSAHNCFSLLLTPTTQLCCVSAAPRTASAPATAPGRSIYAHILSKTNNGHTTVQEILTLERARTNGRVNYTNASP